MSTPSKRGFFITLEGGEGGGKTTLAQSLKQHFETQGRRVLCTREPGGCALAESVRALVLGRSDTVSIGQRAELFLFLAARAQHVAERIAPALEEGVVVICDRFTDSSVAYQGYARGLGMELVRSLSLAATGDLSPDLTFVLDLPPELGLQRARRVSEADRMESEALAFHQRVREGFLRIAKEDPARVHVLDATQPIAVVLEQALRCATERV
ncbi:MAG: dTMP kinase [Chlamydiia bacterium]|nr:dTMP kinase [Chlamydiia bacterium]